MTINNSVEKLTSWQFCNIHKKVYSKVLQIVIVVLRKASATVFFRIETLPILIDVLVSFFKDLKLKEVSATALF